MVDEFSKSWSSTIKRQIHQIWFHTQIHQIWFHTHFNMISIKYIWYKHTEDWEDKSIFDMFLVRKNNDMQCA